MGIGSNVASYTVHAGPSIIHTVMTFEIALCVASPEKFCAVDSLFQLFVVHRTNGLLRSSPAASFGRLDFFPLVVPKPIVDQIIENREFLVFTKLKVRLVTLPRVINVLEALYCTARGMHHWTIRLACPANGIDPTLF